MSNTLENAVLLAPGKGTTYVVCGVPVVCKASRQETGGAFSVFEALVPPTEGPALHIHFCEDEAVYVVDGEFHFQLEDHIIPATTGTFVYIPKGARHTYKNVGSKLGKLLSISTPSGHEELLAELSLLPVDISPTLEMLDGLRERHHIEAPELRLAAQAGEL